MTRCCCVGWRPAGASGKLDPIKEYGAQDFFGQIDELRIWRTVRTQAQIRQVGLLACWTQRIGLFIALVPSGVQTKPD